MADTTMKLDKETLRQLKLRKCVLDFDNYDDLILYMLKFTPDSYTTADKRPKHPSSIHK